MENPINSVSAGAFILAHCSGAGAASVANTQIVQRRYSKAAYGYRRQHSRDGENRILRAIDAVLLGEPTQTVNLTSDQTSGVCITIAKVPSLRPELLVGPTFLVVVDPLVRLPSMTIAEQEVALLIIDGKNMRQIALARGTSRETVKSQTKSIYAKCQVAGQVELISRYRSRAKVVFGDFGD